MTHEEILKLEPGPKLDRLVAEKVMGWKRTTEGAPPGCAYWKDDDGFVRANETPGGSLDWNPSTDIAAAWEVVSGLSDKFDILIDGVGFVRKTLKKKEKQKKRKKEKTWRGGLNSSATDNPLKQKLYHYQLPFAKLLYWPR